jgi:hypothetical protein
MAWHVWVLPHGGMSGSSVWQCFVSSTGAGSHVRLLLLRHILFTSAHWQCIACKHVPSAVLHLVSDWAAPSRQQTCWGLSSSGVLAPVASQHCVSRQSLWVGLCDGLQPYASVNA